MDITQGMCFLNKLFKTKKQNNRNYCKKNSICFAFAFLMILNGKAWSTDYNFPGGPNTPPNNNGTLVLINGDTFTVADTTVSGPFHGSTAVTASVSMAGNSTVTTNFNGQILAPNASNAAAIISNTTSAGVFAQINNTGSITDHALIGLAATVYGISNLATTRSAAATFIGFGVAPFQITNNAGIYPNALIEGIGLQANAMVQTINNSGTIDVGVGVPAINLASSFPAFPTTAPSFVINNNAGGLIENTLGGGLSTITNVVGGGATVTINNNGSITGAPAINNTGPSATWIYIVNAGNNSSMGTFINSSGTANTDQFNVNAGAGGTANLTGNITNINSINVNSGTLPVTGVSTISAFSTFTIASGATTNVTGGTITDVGSFSPTGGTLTINGTLNESAGAVQSTNSLVASGGLVNITGGTFTTTNMTDRGTFTQTGGALTATNFTVTSGGRLTTGPGGTSTFTNLNINAGGTYTQNNNITAGLLTNAGTYTQNGNVTGNVINTGTHFVPTTGAITTRNITGNYTTSGTFSPSIVSTTNYSRITANTANVSGNINVILPSGTTNLHSGDTFDVIVTPSGAALTYNPGTIITPFIFQLVPSKLAQGIVELVVGPFANINTNPNLACIASSLDQISLNPPTANLNTLIQALFNVPNFAAFESALESLLPSVEQGLIINTVSLDQLLLDHISDRLDLMRAGVDLVERGYAAGDIGGGQGSWGPLVYAGSIQQDDIGFNRGYEATTAGVAIVGDTTVRCYGKLGIGISASNTVIKPGFGNASFGNSISFYSVQPLIYGSLDYCGMFVDAFAGIAYNQYRTIRNIPFINETANGKFYGVQTNGQARVGAIIAISTLQFTPIASVRYAHLRQQAYTETGAPIADLSVSGTKETLTQGIYGLKVMEISDPDFFPELHVYYISDIKRPNLLVTAQFAQGGPVCSDLGLLPARNGVDIGGSLSFIFQQMLLTIDGDVELRKKFTGYSGWVRVRWLF